MLYICPICREKTNIESGRLLCRRNHSFDRAREGYFNLLLSNGGVHGDNMDMVIARRAFLSRGYYRPLADRLTMTVLSNAPTYASVLDSGSGEGYYTDIVEKALYKRDEKSDLYAFDISKDAVKKSARLNSRVNFSVASAYRQPFADSSFDLVYNVFSPLALDEVRRVLKRDGIFIMVIPDSEHLFELKAKIYDEPYRNTVGETELSGFSFLSDEPLHYIMELKNNEDVISLFKMTPYAYRTKKENAERILALESLSVSAHFRILTYRKTED